jgi:AraC-like DNA-binding protein
MLVPPYGFVQLHDCADTSAITVSMQTLLRVAEEISGLDRGRVRFTGLLPISPAAEQQWLTVAAYIRRGVYNLTLDQPLILGAAEQLIAATVLRTFPNTTMAIDISRTRDTATPAVVRRAMAYIEEHATSPITLSDIANAVPVVPRTLQYAFRRHRDTTPLAYLRRVRLARVHDELVAARPGDGTTVSAVAAKWGYTRMSRFTAAYRQVYVQPPSRTLRTGPPTPRGWPD